jgi:hypothetical protein
MSAGNWPRTPFAEPRCAGQRGEKQEDKREKTRPTPPDLPFLLHFVICRANPRSAAPRTESAGPWTPFALTAPGGTN